MFITSLPHSELPPMVPSSDSPTWRVQARLSVGLYRAHQTLRASELSPGLVRRAVYDVLAELEGETHVGTILRALGIEGVRS